MNRENSMESIKEDNKTQSNKFKKFTHRELIALTLLVFFIFVAFFDIDIKPRRIPFKLGAGQAFIQNDSNLEETVLPQDGVALPVQWGDLGKKMIEAGVIDAEKFEALYEQRGGLSDYQKNLLYSADNGNLKIDAQNSGVILNLLWAFGLANKNSILEEGPMQDPQYGGDASRFASTGGWTLASDKVMNHYSKHPFVVLTEKQQELVERVSKNIYRPCCNNPTHFPDCNHGMAMLGFLELMASQGASEEEMYKAALQVNSYWFPDTYITIAKYFEKRGVAWNDISPKDVLGSLYSSASGYRQVLTEVEPPQTRSGGGCGV